MKNFKALDLIAFILVIVGGLNWLLFGLFDFDLVAKTFGATYIAKLVYSLVGLSALYLIVISGKLAKE